MREPLTLSIDSLRKKKISYVLNGLVQKKRKEIPDGQRAVVPHGEEVEDEVEDAVVEVQAEAGHKERWKKKETFFKIYCVGKR